MIETDFLDTLLAAFRWRFEARLSGHLLRGYLTGSAQMVQYGQTKLGRPIYFEGPPMQEAIRFAQRRAAASVKTIEPKFKEDLRKMIVEGIQERKGVDTIRREISKHFEGLEKYQADRIARTETANALQEGSMERGRAMGVTGKEWVVTPYGEWPCDDCEKAEAAGVIAMDQDFPGGVSHPPMHPNAVFAGLAFAPYGSLDQMIRSKYSGPAVTIETERISFTIGQNHPILTRRGWIKASEVHEGDELVYDLRAELARQEKVKAYLNEVSLIQDSFDALRFAFGNASIPAARRYFHGDEVFAYGEIEVVRPTSDLLPIWDSCGIEKLAKLNLQRADAEPSRLAGGSSSDAPLNGVSIPPSRIVGKGKPVDAFLWSHALPHPFESVRVLNAHETSYTGDAFDASTESGLYSYGGIVVKNCACAIAYAMLPEKGD